MLLSFQFLELKEKDCQFGNHLEISKMSNDDKEYIMNTFINAVEKIGKEQINAIQKNT